MKIMAIPFEPVCYDHAAALIKDSPFAASCSATYLANAHLAAVRTYGLTSCVVGMDIYNVEAEALGCDVSMPRDNGMPVIEGSPVKELAQIASRSFTPADGRIPLLFQAAQHIRTAHPDLALYVPMAGPFTLACHLRGMENMICDMAMDPGGAAAALAHLAGLLSTYAQETAARGYGVALFESSVTPPLLSPRMFDDHVAPLLARILDAGTGKMKPQLIIGGDTAPLARTEMGLGAGYVICPVETDQAAFLGTAHTHPDVTVRVNMAPGVFGADKKNEALTEAARAKAVAEMRDNTTVGALLPYDADVDVVLAVAEYFMG